MNPENRMNDQAAMQYLADLDRIASRGLISISEKANAARENCTPEQLERYATLQREKAETTA